MSSIQDRKARYDGVADWYDTYAVPTPQTLTALGALVGEGPGLALDLGCGTGLYLDYLSSRGFEVVGIDLSMDQLRLARGRWPEVVCADGSHLPLGTASVDLVAAIWVSTDFDDPAAVLGEVARVLRPGGHLVTFGVHPCFNGPFVENLDDGSRLVHPGYREGGWYHDAPWWGDGIRRRAGMRHVPLAELFNTMIGAGLQVEHVVEPRDEPVPFILGVKCSLASRP